MLAIVIPYHKITFFEETLQSLANQTDKRFKVYIGDDASIENPTFLLEKYKNQFDFVYYKFEKNLGSISLVKQWERCISLTKNEEWIMLLGDDDYLSEDVVSNFYMEYDCFNGKNTIVRFKSVIVNKDSAIISEYQINPKYEFAASSFIRKIKTQSRSSLSEFVFRTESIKRNDFKDYPLGWHSDDKALIDFSESLPIYSINNTFINVRVSQFSISGKRDNLKLKKEAKVNFYFDLINENFALFNKRDKKLLLKNYEYIKRNYFNLQFKDTVFISSKYLVNHLYISFFIFHFRNLKRKMKMFNEFVSLISWKIKFHFFKFYNNNFNKVVREQAKDYKKIPIIIINYNNLTSLKRLIIFLKKRDINYIIILDNNSTYKPLLEYYSKIENEIKIIKNKKNEGHRVFWKNKSIYKMFKKGYYVVTDSDIEPDGNCPVDFLTYFKKVLDSNNTITKVGFSLKINDLPDTNINNYKITGWESKFWQIQNNDGDYVADIDTTFALYRPLNQFNIKYFYKAIRTNYPYIAKHWGWYICSANLTEEQKFYMETANKSGSWRINEEGELKERHYE